MSSRVMETGDLVPVHSEPSAPRPIVSVIVLNWNNRAYLDRCLAALLDQQLNTPYEVLLVDNASTDGSVEHVRTRWPNVRVVQSDMNLGFAAGNNLGMREAAGCHLVLLNTDTEVQPGWLSALVSVAESDPTVGAVTSKLIFMEDRGQIQNAGTLLLSDGSGADRGFREHDAGQFETREEVFGACGAAALYRRAMLEDVGYFDETFFNYYEDTDLSWRMRLRGWRVIYEPTAVVRHVHAGSSGEWSPFFIFHVDRNRLFMILKNARWRMVVRTFFHFGLLSTKNALRPVGRRVERRPVGADDALQTRAYRRALIHGHVLLSLVVHLPRMLVKRNCIRRRRTVPDSMIERWFYPREQWLAR